MRAPSLARRGRRKIRLMASAAADAVYAGADVSEARLDREEHVIERRIDRIEICRSCIRPRLLLLDMLLGVGLDVLNTGDAIVGAENSRLARIEPDVAQYARAVMVRIRDIILQVGLTHRLDGLVRRHPGA